MPASASEDAAPHHYSTTRPHAGQVAGIGGCNSVFLALQDASQPGCPTGSASGTSYRESLGEAGGAAAAGRGAARRNTNRTRYRAADAPGSAISGVAKELLRSGRAAGVASDAGSLGAFDSGFETAPAESGRDLASAFSAFVSVAEAGACSVTAHPWPPARRWPNCSVGAFACPGSSELPAFDRAATLGFWLPRPCTRLAACFSDSSSVPTSRLDSPVGFRASPKPPSPACWERRL